jgi:hypothetical protein
MADQVTTGRFVGRTQELERLRELLARATDGQPLLVLLGGEAGVGKTRLAEQLAAAAQEQGARMLYGGCVPLGEEGVPFAPVSRRCGAWPTSWTRPTWRRSPAPPGRSWPGCSPTWPGAAPRPQHPPSPRARVRGSCSSGYWG